MGLHFGGALAGLRAGVVGRFLRYAETIFAPFCTSISHRAHRPALRRRLGQTLQAGVA